MIEHPGIELQVLIKEKGLTQKAFASILGKKVSEVNELLKGKRNITIQRDYLLHQSLGTPVKYWILKQVDYEYSLLDTEILNNQVKTPSQNSELPKESNTDKITNPEVKPFKQTNNQSPQQNIISKEDKDLQDRAKIFRSF